MTRPYDLLVIGGGPAGVGGALTVAQEGLRVALVDGAARLGGQYFRHRAGEQPASPRFARQCAALGSIATVLTNHQVWAISRAEDDGLFVVHCLVAEPGGERPVTLRATRVLIATGAHDRPLPFPGWDLPGVFTPGGAQALLKGRA
ncbi:FAD-dependent oxidoreductase [Nonomuraea sp. NBC_01738]|uniref:FAD-dependent oxidoreductase n=1 Tax=Nonomuraea sp. NBC_01738 TaxID=2976003 RepID=UPI002E15F7DF|nr:FAD-dependent oxidoreductase [Nonomuraea sp. NBC_01738]